MPPALVEGILKKAQEEEEKAIQSVSVEKQIELTYDLAHLAAFDTNKIDLKEFRSDREGFIERLTRENTQLVVNQLWQLQTKREDNVVVAILPKPTYNLPREKPAPKAKPLTKWEQFAKEKGIQHKKKDKLVWDEVSKDWKPRFGYRGINQQNDQWVIEVPENADPEVDYFEKRTDEKKERVAKNEVQRLRNIARASRLKLPGTGGIIPPEKDLTKDQLSKAQVLAKESTASMGKFTESLPDEKPPKNLGKRRKFESNLDSLNEEKERTMNLASSVLAKQKKPIDDSAEEQALQSFKKLKRSKSKGRGGGGGDDDDNEDIGDRFDKKNRKRGGGGGRGGRGGGAGRGGGGGSSGSRDFRDRHGSGGGGGGFGGRGRGGGGPGRGRGGGAGGGGPSKGGNKFGGRSGPRKPGSRGGGKRR